MATDTVSSSPRSDPVEFEAAKEDADTAAARKELKQTAISDEAPDGKAARAAATPESDLPDAQSENLKEQVSSPKKKRAHDEVEDDQEQDKERADAKSDVSTDSGRDRTARAEPEKKRPRDEAAEQEENSTSSAAEHSAATKSDAAETIETKLPHTSAAKFQASGFGQLSSAASPFGNLGGGEQKSIFGAPAGQKSVFASSSAKPAAPTLSFGGPPSGDSPFGAFGKANGLGGGGGFGSTSVFRSAFAVAGAKPLSTFGSPGQGLKNEKSAKPFGAPDSDAEDDGDEAEDEGGASGETDNDADKEEGKKEDAKGDSEDKKQKLQRVEINDGETGEVTLLAVRAKMFYVDKAENRWIERGSGMLKINVPESCVSYDETTGAPVPGSFDASGLDEDEDADEGDSAPGSKVTRLIMRQDHTHRILLNTAVLPAMKFQEKASLKAVGVLFTAFEGEDAKPVSVQMKMSAASAKSFLSEVGLVQRELQNH